MTMSQSDQPVTIYQLKITLDHFQQPIWRRVQLPDCSLAAVHSVIQSCLEWDDDHLHMFEAAGGKYSSYPDPYDPKVRPARSAMLSQLVQRGCDSFSYTYDFGDDWKHTIEIEKTIPSQPTARYPRCVEGQRAGPPEDCGGVYGYEHLLSVIQDPDNQEHEEMKEWVGDGFDPEHFDPDEINNWWSRCEFEPDYGFRMDEQYDEDEDYDEDHDEDDDYEEEDYADEDYEHFGGAPHDYEEGPLEKPLPFVRQTRAGRNDPCPCGSGKKYKKCCLKKQDVESSFE